MFKATRISPLIFLLVTLLALFVAPAGALAQVNEWRERSTEKFTILYEAGQETEADRYAGFVDDVYNEIATAFSFRTATPLTLRLYPTGEDYYLVNPIARNVPGVVAHADFMRRELVVIVERTRQQSEEEVRNNVRHELTHIVASDLSGNRLNTGFQEGIAQYVEKPAPELERKIEALRQAADQGRLLPWSAFEDRDQIYGAPEVAYPQSLAVVAFLVEREGFARLRELLTVTARSSGYRSALERVYGASPGALEAAWLQWLPEYLAGGYKHNALATYDLTYARNLVEQGNYAAAESELAQAMEWLNKNTTTQPPEVVAAARALLEKADNGMQAERLAEAARLALESADYERAQQLVDRARSAYSEIGDTRNDAVLEIYSERVARGQYATDQLIQAGELARTLRLPQARAAADTAAAEFAALGDRQRLDNARALRRSLDERQRTIGIVLVIMGLFGISLSLVGRVFQRPAEVW